MRFDRRECDLIHRIARALTDEDCLVSRADGFIEVDLTRDVPRPYYQDACELIRRSNAYKDGQADILYREGEHLILRVHPYKKLRDTE